MGLVGRHTGIALVAVVGLGCASTPAPQPGASGASGAGGSATGASGMSQGGAAAGAAGASQATAGESATGGAAGGGGSGGSGGDMALAPPCGVDAPGAIVFSPASGTFEGSVTVTLSSGVAT
ncbi:MAG TPA: hypothetical protein VEX18_09330, partial [Polyangiaceae bacterium]|nr:hypothetical protein [Polyangiaceae bacterium]